MLEDAWPAAGKSSASFSSTSSSVLGAPLAVFLITGRPSLPNRISPICFGRAQVERLAGQRVRLLLERDHAFAQLVALLRQPLRVDQHAVCVRCGYSTALVGISICS